MDYIYQEFCEYMETKATVLTLLALLFYSQRLYLLCYDSPLIAETKVTALTLLALLFYSQRLYLLYYYSLLIAETK